MARKGKSSYVIVRDDWFVIHTKPITWEEAEWLYRGAYSTWFLDRAARARYLGEWGNVLDVSDYAERLRQLGVDLPGIGIYGGPAWFMEQLGLPLGNPRLGPGARRIVEELLDKTKEFLRRPVEPRPIEAPVRYLELSHRHVMLASGPDGIVREVEPKPEWHAYVVDIVFDYGVSVFNDSFWVWAQSSKTYAVAVRRGADDREVINAVLNDGAVQGFLRWFLGEFDKDFRQLIREREAELVDKGYDDVVRKAKVILTTIDLLTAGRYREEEGVPA